MNLWLVAGVRNSWPPLHRRLNLPALLRAQGRELKTIFCSQHTYNFRRNRMLIGVRQWDFESNQFAQIQSFGNEPPETAFAEIARPPWQVKFPAIPLEANSNPRLKNVPRGDPIGRVGSAARIRTCHKLESVLRNV